LLFLDGLSKIAADSDELLLGQVDQGLRTRACESDPDEDRCRTREMPDYAPKTVSGDRQRLPDARNTVASTSVQPETAGDQSLRRGRGLRPPGGAIAQLRRSLNGSPRLALLSQLSAALQRQPERSPNRNQAAVLQAKWFFEDNPNASVDDALYGFQRPTLLVDIQDAIDALADDATLVQAQQAVTTAFGQFGARPANHAIAFVGTSVFLDDNLAVHQDKLGSLADDQDPSMYLPVAAAPGDQNQLFVNKASGETYVRDTNNHFTPRFQSRSITTHDRGRLSGRTDILPAVPNANRTPLEHVGGAPSQYLSLTAGTQDVTNAHGALFNAGGTGRVQIDLLRVAPQNLVDLHVYAGARAELGQRMAGNIRNNFPAIWSAAQTENQNIASGAQTHAGATAARPGSMLSSQTQPWQQILDAIRTKEVLVAGGIPFSSVTAFQNNNAGLAQQANTDIGQHAVASAARTAAAQQVLTGHRTLKGMSNAMSQELRARQLHLKAQMLAAWNAALPGLALAARATRKRQFNTAEAVEKQNLVAMADRCQRKIYTGVIATAPAGVAAFQAAANLSIAAAVAAA
jgi:hypothetical protein